MWLRDVYPQLHVLSLPNEAQEGRTDGATVGDRERARDDGVAVDAIVLTDDSHFDESTGTGRV